MPIDLGTIFSTIKVDASQVAPALAAARAQFKAFGADTASSFDSGTVAVKRQMDSIQQWKAEQTSAAQAVQNTTTQVKQQTAAITTSSQSMMQQMRTVSALRAASAEMAIAGTAIAGALAVTIKTGAEWETHLTQSKQYRYDNGANEGDAFYGRGPWDNIWWEHGEDRGWCYARDEHVPQSRGGSSDY